jgi:hypothetical protein
VTGTTAGLTPGAEVASRFRVDEALTERGARQAFLGTDAEDGGRVVLFALTPSEAEVVRPIEKLDHAHLSRVRAIAEAADGTPVLVVEHVVGPTLHEVLSQVEHETPVEAVRSALRVADAVCAIHNAGAVHGCIRPAALIVAPDGHPPPRLTFAPPLLGANPYRSASRGDGPPTVADDSWAVAALLYEMLLGTEPPPSGLTSDADLAKAGVDEELRAAIVHALAANEAERAQDLTRLKRELASWFVNNSVDNSSALSRGSAPPPLPPASVRQPSAARPVTRGGASAPGSARNRNLIAYVLAGVAFVATVGVVWGYFAWGAKEVEVAKAPQSASARPKSSEASIDLNAVSVMGDEDAGLGDQMASCVGGWLPSGAFGKPPDLGWVCKQSDPLQGSAALKSALVKYKPPGQVTDAMKVFSQLGWYEMAAYSVVHAGCCADAEALKLVDPAPGCARLDEPLNTIGASVVANQSPTEAVDAFDKAAKCEAKAQRAGSYNQNAAPTGAERAAFEDYLKRIQAP